MAGDMELDDDALSGLSDEDMQKLMALGVIPDKNKALQDQMTQADYLRNAQVPEGRNSGRVYTAANPLEVVGAVMQHYKGEKEMKQLRDQQSGLFDQAQQGRMAFLNALRGPRGPTMPNGSRMQPPPMQGMPVNEANVPQPQVPMPMAPARAPAPAPQPAPGGGPMDANAQNNPQALMAMIAKLRAHGHRGGGSIHPLAQYNPDPYGGSGL